MNGEMNNVKCPDCQVVMEEGYVPDSGHMGLISESVWYKDKPNRSKYIAGLINASSRSITITTYRCPECGLLREYALGK